MKSLFLAAITAIPFIACRESSPHAQWARDVTGGGEPSRGRVLLTSYGCVACHTIDGIRESQALVGPPLTRMASRSYVAGMLENTPGNMILWIQQPRQVNPKTAMPNLNVSDRDARDIASYLYMFQ